jgi:hypothetical protein
MAYHLYYKTVIIDMYFYYWWAIHLLDLATLYSSWMKNPDLCTCMEWHQSFQVLNQTASWMCANVTSWQFDHHGFFCFFVFFLRQHFLEMLLCIMSSAMWCWSVPVCCHLTKLYQLLLSCSVKPDSYWDNIFSK